MLPVFIGYDPREDLAYNVARFSFYRRATQPLAVRPLGLAAAPMCQRPIERRDGKLWCPISGAPMATEFAVSRFALPWVAEDADWALFVDCDVLALADVAELFDEADPSKAVQVVQHGAGGHVPTSATKMDGATQTFYARKNWSSVVLWNLRHPGNRRFTIDMLNGLPGRDLHAFCWLEAHEIGHLNPRWNWLVSEQPRPVAPGIAHYTLGGPWFPKWEPRAADDLWNRECAILASMDDAA
jgi:lipopolysaccharide biosynthesis glycosyltransferase